MKYYLTLMVLIMAPSAICQHIEQVTVIVQQHDEPPTKKGRRDQFTIQYKRGNEGDLEAKTYSQERKTIALHKNVAISPSARATVEEWLNTNKKSFPISSFHADESMIRKRQSDPEFALIYELPGQILINTDSFNFCQPHLMRRAMVIGGVRIDVQLLINGELKTFHFDSSDERAGNFDLHGYLLCYRLLNDALPDDFPATEYFSTQKMTDVVLQYYKVIECEGFYYEEYKERNPELSPSERRQQWNLKRYLRDRQESR